MNLLPRDALLKTGEVDHADWNFRPLLGAIQRQRFKQILKLLGQDQHQRLLEIGYGSGVFLPELARHCRELHGIDIHDQPRAVMDIVKRHGFDTHLVTGSAARLPYDDQFFDCIVAVSSLEFIEDIHSACLEIKRVLKPDGSLLMVTPGHSWLVDWGLKLLTGESAKRDYGQRRDTLKEALAKHFIIQQRRTVPPIGASLVCLYTALKLAASPSPDHS